MYIERIENLIRVVSSVPDERFDICKWYDARSKCGCAIGHAMQDAYFIARRLEPPLGRIDVYEFIGNYFGIDEHTVCRLFVWSQGYSTRRDVLCALRVLLLEKTAQELPECLESEIDELEPNYAGYEPVSMNGVTINGKVDS